MRVVVAGSPGGPDVLGIVERPVPAPGIGEVLIKVAAAGINGSGPCGRAGGTRE